METITLIACCSAKLEHRAPASQLYVSALFRKSVAAAEAQGQRWFVLSALHGLVSPEQALDPYDLTLASASKPQRTEWASRVLQQIAMQFPAPVRFAVLAGRNYREPLLALLEAAGHHSVVPLAGLGIGRQLAALSVPIRWPLPDGDTPTQRRS